MPVFRRTITATDENAIANWNYRNQGGESLVTVMASSAAAGESLTYSVSGQDFTTDAVINLESADRVIDPERDWVLMQERCPPGEHAMAITAVGVDTTFEVQIDPIPESL